ncbi:MAG TPA: hypothetical protein VLX28_23700, partial [Thermoanaerobaculia bacterium]|nr:hypothetical protein [Thermoanaerobaculia bacterium]
PRSARLSHRPVPVDPKPVLPPVETPEGAPELGFLIAFEEPGAPDGWASGIVKAVEDGWDGRHFTVDTRAGEQEVPRELVFYWWSLD